MVVLEKSVIYAPVGRCFSLSTRVELVRRTLRMKPVSGVTSGHVSAGSRVVWRGWKFGLPTEHHTLITGFKAPHREDSGEAEAWFQDSQERGRFERFRHDHYFREVISGVAPVTMLRDEVRFALPFGALGKLVAKHVMAPYIAKLARQRFAMIKEMAEGEGWREWVDDTSH